MTEARGLIVDGNVGHYQAHLKLGFAMTRSVDTAAAKKQENSMDDILDWADRLEHSVFGQGCKK